MYISVFLPDFLCRHGHFDERENCAEYCSERNDTYISTGHFFTAVLGVSGIALPIVLYRAALLTTTSFVLSFIGMALFLACVVAFIHLFYIEDEDAMSFF